MKIRTPNYYHMFRCIASACPDSCCKEWEIDVDDATAAFYQKIEGPLGDHLRKILRTTDDGTIIAFEDGHCPMQRKDGLCQVQAELGHDALCQVCRDYPRLRHDYGDFVEYGLELSCPEAARLILSQSHAWIEKDAPDAEAPDYDPEAMAVLLESRKAVMAYLDSTSLPSELALAVLLIYSHDVQNWLDGGEPAILDESACLDVTKENAAQGDWTLLLDFFRNLEILTPQWRTRLNAPVVPTQWHMGFLSLAKYFIGRYWLQAVSDYDLIGRVKLMIVSCLLLYRLGGDFLETAQLFSKEIENDPDNMNAILDGAYTAPAFTDRHLLSLLINS